MDVTYACKDSKYFQKHFQFQLFLSYSITEMFSVNDKTGDFLPQTIVFWECQEN